MKLTVDIQLNSQLVESRALAELLGKSKVSVVPMPLEAVLAQDFGLQQTPDYPLAALAASTDGLAASEGYWFRADPVHLLLQRDSFSLGEPAPLAVLAEHAETILDSLNQHFADDGITFLRGVSGAWYIKVTHAPQIKTTLPHAVLGRNIHGFMPQGADAAKWRSLMNELQMLLFEHPVNVAREQEGALAINSLWLSAGGVLPTSVKHSGDGVVLANTPLYLGLASKSGLSLNPVPNNFEQLFTDYASAAQIRLQLPETAPGWFEAMAYALKKRRLELLTLNIGFYERSLVVLITPLHMYRFWRRAKTVESYLV